MSQAKFKKEIDNLFSQKVCELSDIIELVNNCKGEINKSNLEFIKQHIVKYYIKHIDLYSTPSEKEIYLSEELEAFEHDFFKAVFGRKHNKYINVIKQKVISNLNEEIEKLYRGNFRKVNTNSRKIQLKQDTSILISLFLELEKQKILVFSEDRLGRLFEENFISSKGTVIKRGTIKTMCSKGISQMQNADLKGILKQIIQELS